jgi:hypothetical protein
MLIHNATLVSWDETERFPEDQALLLRDGRIVASGNSTDLLDRHRMKSAWMPEASWSCPAASAPHFYSASPQLAIPGRAPRSPELRKLW